MKPTLFLIGMILSALGIILGIAFGSGWMIFLFIGLIIIAMNSNFEDKEN